MNGEGSVGGTAPEKSLSNEPYKLLDRLGRKDR